MEIKLKFDNKLKLKEFLKETQEIMDKIGLTMTPLNENTKKAVEEWHY